MAHMMKAGAQRAGPEWPATLIEEFERNQFNGCVGTRLLSETDRVRVWSINLKPGERIGFHRHVLDYFWTAVTTGVGLSRLQDGSTVESRYNSGETRHESYRRGEYKVHDLENIGDTELVFTTVEFLNSENDPLPLADTLRANEQ
jgi:hypothetical protein